MRILLAWLALCACAAEAPKEQPEAIRPGSTMDAELHYDRGVALTANGRHSEAIDAYLQAAKLAPGYTKVHYNLGNALQVMAELPDGSPIVLRLPAAQAVPLPGTRIG